MAHILGRASVCVLMDAHVPLAYECVRESAAESLMCNGALLTNTSTSKLEWCENCVDAFLCEKEEIVRSIDARAPSMLSRGKADGGAFLIANNTLPYTYIVIRCELDARFVPTLADKHPHLRAGCARAFAAQPPSKAYPSHSMFLLSNRCQHGRCLLCARAERLDGRVE